MKLFLIFIVINILQSFSISKVKRSIKKLENAVKVLQIGKKIQKKVLKNKIKIKNIKIGKTIRRKLNIKSGEALKKIVSHHNINKEIKRINKKILQLKKKLKKNRKLPSIPFMDKKKDADNVTKFMFKPLYDNSAYMPIFQQGPVFGAPMKLVINTLPHPNTRAEKFYEIAQQNANHQSIFWDEKNKFLQNNQKNKFENLNLIQSKASQTAAKILQSTFGQLIYILI